MGATIVSQRSHNATQNEVTKVASLKVSRWMQATSDATSMSAAAACCARGRGHTSAGTTASGASQATAMSSGYCTSGEKPAGTVHRVRRRRLEAAIARAHDDVQLGARGDELASPGIEAHVARRVMI